MMKTLVLVLALVVVAGGICTADTCTVDLYSNWNVVACPLVPFDPDPNSVFGGVDIDGRVARYDAPSQSFVSYDAIDPTAFGNCLLGEGYLLENYANVDSFSYSGVPDGVPDASNNMTDMWISLPGNQLDAADAGGWHIVGHPFNHDTAIDLGSGTGDNVLFTDGTTLKTWDEAFAAGWVEDVMSYFDASTQSYSTLSYGLGDDDHFRSGKGYYLFTRKDNLAMIITANPS